MGGPLDDLPLVGRARELTALREALASADAGRARAVLVTGEAGVGKSRLVRALLDDPGAPAPVVLRSQGVDLGDTGLPHLVVTDLVRGVRSLAGDAEVSRLLAAAPLVDALGPTSTDPRDPRDPGADETRPLRVFDALTELLAELARHRGPLAVVVEDLQWVDPSSAAFLRFLLGRLADERLLVVATVRTDGLAGRPATRRLVGELARLPRVHRVDVEPLDEAEVATLVGHLTSGGPDPDLPSELVRRTGGNPYFVRTLLTAVDLDRDPDPVAAVRSSRALADVLAARLDALSDEARAVVAAVSVAGRSVPDRLLRQVVGLGPVELGRAVREAVAEGVLTPAGGDHAVSHDLMRAAAYDDLLPGERVRLHSAYATALSADTFARPRAAEVAHHAARAQDGPATLLWSVRAAEDAMRVLAPTEALAHLELALSVWPAVDDATAVTGLGLAKLTVRAARAAGLAGEGPRAVELASRAVRLADTSEEPTTAVHARAELVRALVAADATDAVVGPAEEAVAVAGAAAVDARTRALADVVLARALLAARQTSLARQPAERAIVRSRDAGAAALEVDALTTAAFLDEVDGDRDRAADRLRSALLLARTEGELAAELRAHYTLASLHFYGGDVAAALPVLRAGLGRVAETGLRWSHPGIELRLLDAVARYVSGDLQGSLEATRSHGSRPPPVAAARLAAVGGYASVALGLPEAGEQLGAVRGDWHLDPQVGLVAGGCEADRLTWAGDPSAAAEMAEQAQAHLDTTAGEGMYGGLWLSALGLAALGDLAAGARGRRDDDAVARALERGEVLRDRVRRIVEGGRGRPGGLGPEGHAWHVRALAEHARLRGEPAVEPWLAAVDAFGYGHVYEQARSQWRLAEAYADAGDRDAARAHVAVAATTAERLGAVPLQRAIAGTVAASRLSAASAGSGAAGTVLTSRERDVLALVAEGLTNREVGRRLFISEKTVSVHLSNLMAKLNVSSRTEAVTVAVRRGLLDVQGSVTPP
ncbi:helix-turn-helix transcriptional regulator [Terrabacter koreensis]